MFRDWITFGEQNWVNSREPRGKEIGADLGVSESAIKATVQQLFRRMRVRTRAQLVRIAIEESLCAPSGRSRNPVETGMKERWNS